MSLDELNTYSETIRRIEATDFVEGGLVSVPAAVYTVAGDGLITLPGQYLVSVSVFLDEEDDTPLTNGVDYMVDLDAGLVQLRYGSAVYTQGTAYISYSRESVDNVPHRQLAGRTQATRSRLDALHYALAAEPRGTFGSATGIVDRVVSFSNANTKELWLCGYNVTATSHIATLGYTQVPKAGTLAPVAKVVASLAPTANFVDVASSDNDQVLLLATVGDTNGAWLVAETGAAVQLVRATQFGGNNPVGCCYDKTNTRWAVATDNAAAQAVYTSPTGAIGTWTARNLGWRVQTIAASQGTILALRYKASNDYTIEYKWSRDGGTTWSGVIHTPTQLAQFTSSLYRLTPHPRGFLLSLQNGIGGVQRVFFFDIYRSTSAGIHVTELPNAGFTFPFSGDNSPLAANETGALACLDNTTLRHRLWPEDGWRSRPVKRWTAASSVVVAAVRKGFVVVANDQVSGGYSGYWTAGVWS